MVVAVGSLGVSPQGHRVGFYIFNCMERKFVKYVFSTLVFVYLLLAFFLVKGITFGDVEGLISGVDLKKMTPKVFIVRSGSMSPGLPVGSVIAVKPQSQYKEGDVISFTRGGGQFVTHRITSVVDNSGVISYETKGDANSGPDRELVASGQVVGSGFYALPYAGYALSFMKTKTGFTLFIMIPAVLIILGEMKIVKDELRKMFSNTGLFSGLKKPSFYFFFVFFLLIVPFKFFNVSEAIFSDYETAQVSITTGVWGDVTPTPIVWDKSSLFFANGFQCNLKRNEVRAKVCNGKDSEDMKGDSSWELYYIKKGNPKNGEIVGQGTISPLIAGECRVLSYSPSEGLSEGIYMFKAYQRPGHPGKGELWSNECVISSCERCECDICKDICKEIGCMCDDICGF